MKRVKMFLTVLLCVCMLLGGTAFAQEENLENTLKVKIEEEKIEESKPDAQTQEGSEENKEIAESESQKPVIATTAVRANDIAIDETNFPDDDFRKYIKESFDKNQDDSLSTEEIDTVTVVDVHEKMISDLSGIEYFTKLENLNCSDNIIKSLDVSKNEALVYLFCGNNQLTALDVSKNKALEYLFCSNSQLTALDVSKNLSLYQLECSFNQLKTFDESKNTELAYLSCNSNSLSMLDVSKNTRLFNFACSYNKLTELDISKNTELVHLHCDNNQLSVLDVSNNKGLATLGCQMNHLVKLDVDMLEHVKDGLELFMSPQYINVTGYVENGRTVVNLSNILLAEDLKKVSVYAGEYNSSTGIWILPDPKENPLIPCYDYLNGAKDSEDGRDGMGVMLDIEYMDNDENIKKESNESEVKIYASGIDTSAVYNKFNVDPAVANTEIRIKQNVADIENQEYLEKIAVKSGNTVLKVYDVVMTLYADGVDKGQITDGFGNLMLSLYAGKEYAGKTAVVYQLHGTDEVITYSGLRIDKDGMVTITVSKLSTFAVALQDVPDSTLNQVSGNGTANSVRTGDNASVFLWIMLFVLAAAVIFTRVRRFKL